MKPKTYRTGLLVLGASLVTQISWGQTAYNSVNTFDSPLTLGANQSAGGWYPDRYRPAAFESFDLAGENVLRVAIDGVADGSSGRPNGQGATFYNTHGRKLDLPPATFAVKGSLYVPSSWLGASDRRRSDIWATAVNGSGVVSGYPIIGVANVDGTPVVRYYAPTGEWVVTSVPVVADSWYEFEMILNGDQLTYRVNGADVGTVTFAGSTRFSDAIFQAYNFNDPALAVSQQSSASYDAYWDNFGVAHSEVRNATQNTLHPTIQAAIDAATEGDVIELTSGNYSGPVSINKDGITLKAAASATSKPKLSIIGTTGALGTVLIAPGADNVTVEGLEIVGFDGPMALEKAAVYLQGAHNGFTLRGNTVTAKGDSAILTEYGHVNSNIVIDGNLIDGVTFDTSIATGVVPSGLDQWSVPNVPRVLVYMGSGNPPTHSNVTFTNNVVSAASGDATNGNVLVALHTAGSTVSGNTFSGTTGVTAGRQLLRVNGTAATVSGNTFSGTASIAVQAGGNTLDTAATSSVTSNRFTGTFTSKVANASTSSLNASNNFWGDASKPESTTDFAGNVQPLPYFKDAAFSQAAPVTIATAPAVGYATIQAGINAAAANDTVQVDAGTYNESVTVNKDIDLIGSGAATTTISTTGNIISITSAGSGSSVKGLTTTGGARGFNLSNASDIVLENVASTGNSSFGVNFNGANANITLRDSSFSNNGSSGIKVESSGRVSNFLVEGSTLNGNNFGLYSADGNAATYQANAQLQGITVRNSSFSNNAGKGLFIESMNNGLFEGLTITNSGTGTTGGTGSGFDINLKFANYTNLTVRNSVISGCGVNYSFGGGLLIKARNDGSTYSANPATLGGTVLVEGVRVENNGAPGNGAGIRIGDAIANTSPSNVVIRNSTLSGNNNYAVLNLVTGSTVQAADNHWGAASGPVGATTNMAGPNVNYMPWYGASTSDTPPVLSQSRTGVVENTEIDDEQPPVEDLYVAPGKTITVTPTGGLTAEKIELAEGAEIVVNGGDLSIGDGTKISGTFTIFNSFGSWNVNGDTTFEVSQALALITDIHVAPGKTITVNGGGELILDGCVIDSQAPGSSYGINVATDGLLTLARSVVSDAVIDIDTETGSVDENLKSKVYDNSFVNSDIEASADAQVYHNLFDTATNSASNTAATAAFAGIDGWSNVTDAANLRNRFTLDFVAPADVTNTLDADGNLFVRPGNPVVVDMKVAALAPNTIVNAEALLGFNSAHLILAPPAGAVTPATGWEVVAERDITTGSFGMVDNTLGLAFDSGTNLNGISADSTIGTVAFNAGTPGLTAGFFRVQTNREFEPGGRLLRDTRLTKFDGVSPTDLTAFTANTGELVIDGEKPVIDAVSAEARQVQPSALSPVNVFDPANRVFRNGASVELTFDATDNNHGLSGLDAADAADDVVILRDGVALTSGYTIGATEAGGVVTYTVTLDIPADTAVGEYEISATVQDRSGNPSDETDLGSYIISNEALATVELQGFTGSSRSVTFVATGGVTTTWTKTVNFTGSLGSVILEDVPAGTTSISAKTAWTLRGKATATFTPEGVGSVSLTGTDKLLGGDINGDNVVNTFDYTLLRFNFGTFNTVGDINGDGGVSTGDYNLQRANFYQIGKGQ